MAQLQVGDKVYVKNRFSEEIHTINRVTDKSAFSASSRFVREYDRYVKEVGGKYYCTIATSEQEADLIMRKRRSDMANILSKVNFYNLSYDQLNAILNIIKPQTNGTI